LFRRKWQKLVKPKESHFINLVLLLTFRAPNAIIVIMTSVVITTNIANIHMAVNRMTVNVSPT